jgi:hypothetical protein
MSDQLQGKRIAFLTANEGVAQVDADVVRGRTLTSWPSLRADLRNASARLQCQAH